MKFEVGKYYRHSNPCVAQLHVMGAVTGSVYHMGPVGLVAEEFGTGRVKLVGADETSAPRLVGADETSAENWSECAPWVVNEEEGNVYEAIEEINDVCANHGCVYCGGSGFQVSPRSKCRRGD